MAFPLSKHTIEAVSEIVSGGSYASNAGPIGLYRSGPEMEKFMSNCGVEFEVEGSRVPSLVNCLNQINQSSDAEKTLTRVIVAAADPRDFIEKPKVHQNVVNYLNQFLVYDQLKLQLSRLGMRIVPNVFRVSAFSKLSHKAELLELDNIQEELDRIMDNVATDPADAVTAACSLLESICRSILVQLEEPLPKKKTLPNLYKTVNNSLGLSPDQTDIDQDIHTILSNLASLIQGISTLRTHAGDAHGQEHGKVRIDGRIATLAINSASTMGVFLLETWQRKFPNGTFRQSDV